MKQTQLKVTFPLEVIKSEGFYCNKAKHNGSRGTYSRIYSSPLWLYLEDCDKKSVLSIYTEKENSIPTWGAIHKWLIKYEEILIRVTEMYYALMNDEIFETFTEDDRTIYINKE